MATHKTIARDKMMKKGDQILIDKAVSLAQNKVNYKFWNEYIQYMADRDATASF